MPTFAEDMGDPELLCATLLDLSDGGTEFIEPVIVDEGVVVKLRALSDSELAIGGFDVAILPTAAWLDEERRHAEIGKPASHRLGHELGSVI